jgi:alkanesulfonate monooxygenase SsuD/methylene tetrahydromethanopterin reductase-like flavin-dependent oxidoreductase (luciferase family)
VTRIALHCSHEQIPPSRMLQAVRRAEEAGFDAGMSSDHFSPWSERQGESGFAWSFIATVHGPVEHLRRMIDAFGSGGGHGPLVLQVHLSWAATEEEALRIAHDQWRTNVFDPPLCWDLDTPEAFDVAASHVRPEDLPGKVLVSADLGRHLEWLREMAALGFDEIALHHVGQDLDPFIDAFGEHVLPGLRAA